MKPLKLVCTNCGSTYPIDAPNFRCRSCNEPLEIENITNGVIDEKNVLQQSILERYQAFLPFQSVSSTISLGEGFTPLLESDSLAEKYGLHKFYLKNETANPTWSFKDRGTVVGIQHALKLGYKKIGTVSTGNMAVSVAAYGSKAGLETFVFVSKQIALEKLNPIAIYQPHLIKVEGNYGDLYFESLKLGEKEDIYFINSDQPFRVEGSKTISLEIYEQMNGEVPDYVIVPTSAGGNLRGILKGFEELKSSGLSTKIPKIICAQSSGCSPIYEAYKNDSSNITRIENPNTIAHAIENPYPPSGNQVLRKLQEHGGFSIAVNDEEIIEAQSELASEGVFGQPASAVPLAVINKLKNKDFFTGTEKIVSIVTGSGLKYTAAFDKHELFTHDAKLEQLQDYISKNFKKN